MKLAIRHLLHNQWFHYHIILYCNQQVHSTRTRQQYIAYFTPALLAQRIFMSWHQPLFRTRQ